jgi:release factor glutamine methyltransferase
MNLCIKSIFNHQKPHKVHHLISEIACRLDGVSDSSLLDAQVILAHVMGKTRSWILAHPEEYPSTNQLTDLKIALEQLEQGVPLPYVIGHWEFYGFDFKLTPDVLIPRPETEILVEEALNWLQNHSDKRIAMDVGTGSGCIAVTLLKKIHNLRVTATDISDKALKVAQTNSREHGVHMRINFICTNLIGSIYRDQSIDLICANLPYIPINTLYSLDVYNKEPYIALSGGLNGLDKIQSLLETAPYVISKKGLILLEINADQGELVINMAKDAFPERRIHLIQDFSGNDRVVKIDNSNIPQRMTVSK